MTTILTILFCIGALFLFIMATPIGFTWVAKDLHEGNPCYGLIAAFMVALVMCIIGLALGILH